MWEMDDDASITLNARYVVLLVASSRCFHGTHGRKAMRPEAVAPNGANQPCLIFVATTQSKGQTVLRRHDDISRV